jgi:hypothetical protein
MLISAVNRSTKSRFSGGKFAFDHAEVKESRVSSAVFIAVDDRRRGTRSCCNGFTFVFIGKVDMLRRRWSHCITFQSSS